MLLQAFRASAEHGTNSYCMTDLCTDCKDSEKVVQHIESNSACFLSSQVLPLIQCRTLWRSTACWGGQGREGARELKEGKTMKWNIGLPLLLAHLSSNFIMAHFFLKIGLWFVFLFPIHLVNNCNMPGIVIGTGKTAINRGPASVELTFWLGSLLLTYFILLKVFSWPRLIPP